MTQLISYAEWTSQYEGELMSVGASQEDAFLAAQLGWNITKAHQACYGIESATPVHYSLEALSGYPRPIAGCRGPKFDEVECYIIYTDGLSRRLSELQEYYGGSVSQAVVMEGVAVHEVRHRIQEREAQSVKFFKRSQLQGIWPNNLFVQVCWNMLGDFVEREMNARNAGVSEEDIRWIFSDAEYDAAVVERMFIHLYGTLNTDAQLAKLIRMDCPRLDFMSRT